jgi:hypothetical protein
MYYIKWDINVFLTYLMGYMTPDQFEYLVTYLRALTYCYMKAFGAIPPWMPGPVIPPPLDAIKPLTPEQVASLTPEQLAAHLKPLADAIYKQSQEEG